MEFIDQVIAAFQLAVDEVISTLPDILAALVILIIGWLVAGLVAGLVVRVLRTVRFNELADRAELDEFLERTGSKLDPAEFIGALVKWFVRIIFLVAAANILNLPQVSEFLNEVLAYLPNVAVAVAVFFLGALLARFARDLTRGAVMTADTDQMGLASMSSTIVYWAIMFITVLTALEQLGIATVLTETLYIAFFGGAAVALALAFGLGLRESAADIASGWTVNRTLQTGDMINVGEYSGRVSNIGPTNTTVSNGAQEVIIPNSYIANALVTKSN